MKRKILLAFAIGVVGLIGYTQAGADSQTSGRIELVGLLGKHHPVNGKCPVCGTMAPRWKRPIGMGMDGDVPIGPVTKVVRCPRCNAAFWQDAEKGDKK